MTMPVMSVSVHSSERTEKKKMQFLPSYSLCCLPLPLCAETQSSDEIMCVLVTNTSELMQEDVVVKMDMTH